MLSIIFFGTPEYAKIVLRKLLEYKNDPKSMVKMDIAAVVSAPDAPLGRKQILTPSPVKQLALENIIPVLTPTKLDKEFTQSLTTKYQTPNTLFLLAAYNKIVPKSLFDLPKYGFLNIHPSFLPEWRGPSPVQSAIISGESHTGTTVMKLDEKIDHGPLIAQQGVKIDTNETALELGKRLFETGADLFLQILPEYIKGHIKGVPQNEKKSIYTRKISTQDGFIEKEALRKAILGQNLALGELPPLSQEIIKMTKVTPAATGRTIHNFIRALSPEPGAWSLVGMGNLEKRLKILKTRFEKNRFTLDLVQLEGKNPVSFNQFQEAYSNIF